MRRHVCNQDGCGHAGWPDGGRHRFQGFLRLGGRGNDDQLRRLGSAPHGHLFSTAIARAIYIRPFCIDTAVFQGDEALSDGEMPIRKALAPVEFATDLKEQLEKIAPARILKDSESPRTGWLVEGNFTLVDGGNPYARFFLGDLGAGRSELVLHVRIIDVDRGMVVYEFDMAGGSRFQGRHGTVRASGLGRATHFDMVNAAERIYITLSTNPYHYGARGNISLPE